MIIDATGWLRSARPGDSYDTLNGWRLTSDEERIGILVHHTVTEVDEDATPTEEQEHILVIDRAHQEIGYGGFGYNGIVFPSGRRYRTGRIEGQRVHIKDRNHEFVGYALVGDFTARQPTAAQWAGLRELVAEARGRYGPLPIAGHGDEAVPGWGTECPGAAIRSTDWERVLASVQPEPDDPLAGLTDSQLAHAIGFLYSAVWHRDRRRMHAFDRDVIRRVADWLESG